MRGGFPCRTNNAFSHLRSLRMHWSSLSIIPGQPSRVGDYGGGHAWRGSQKGWWEGWQKTWLASSIDPWLRCFWWDTITQWPQKIIELKYLFVCGFFFFKPFWLSASPFLKSVKEASIYKQIYRTNKRLGRRSATFLLGWYGYFVKLRIKLYLQLVRLLRL